MKSVILVAGGSSINIGIELGLWEKIKGQEIWSLNYAWMTMPYLPKRELWVDSPFFRWNVTNLQKLSEKGVIVVSKKHKKYSLINKIQQHITTKERKRYFGKKALEEKVIFIGLLGLVGTFGLSLAVAEHYDIIYLLGYDFGTPKKDEKITHYYQNKLNVKSTGVGNPYVYRTVKGDFKEQALGDYNVFTREEDINIINVSPNSNIPYFSKINYEEFFKEIKNDTGMG